MWKAWFATNGVALPVTPSQKMLKDRHFQRSSTINGLGVLPSAFGAVRADLRSGALENPIGVSFATFFADHLIVPLAADLSPSARTFHDWLLRISATEAAPGSV